MSDSTRFDMTDVPRRPALEIAFGSRTATHWKHDTENNRFILAWTEPKDKGFHPFPAPVDSTQAGHLIEGWLTLLDYGSQPDHDGHNRESFRIYNESWGHVGGLWQAFAAIEPAWAMYGK